MEAQGEKGSSRFWAVFLGVIILGSPLLKGGDTYVTAAGLRLLVIFGSLYFFSGRIKQGTFSFTTPSGGWILLALLLVLSASLLTTNYFFITIYWYTIFLSCLLLFFLALNLMAGDQDNGLIKALFWASLASGLIQSGIGIGEYFFKGGSRATGSFFNPAYYAGYLAALISFPLAGAVYDLWPGISGRKKTALRLGMAAATLIIFCGILVSASRVIIFLLAPLGLVLVARSRRLGAAAIILAALALVFIPNPVRDRIKSINSDPYAWERVTIWKSSLRMIKHHPAGVGLGMYQYYYHRYMYPMRNVKIGRYGQEAWQSHNEFLNFSAESSVLVPLLALGFLGLVLVRTLRTLRKDKPSGPESGMLLAFGGSLLAVLAHSMVDFNLHQPPVMALAVLDLAGFLTILSRRDPGLVRTEQYDTGAPGLVRACLFGAGVLMAGLIAYQSAVEGLYYQALKAGKQEQRVHMLYRLSRLPTGYAPVYFQLGEEFRKSYIQTAELNLGIQSVKYFEFAAGLNREDYHTYFQWAECLYRVGILVRNVKVFNESEDLCLKSAALGPGQVFSYLLISNIEYVKKDFKKSERWLMTALDYEPYFLRARSRLSAVLLEDGEYRAAGREFQELMAQKKEADEILSKPDGGLSSYQKLLLAVDQDELANIQEKLGGVSAQP
jgi:O-antigen ligase/tetratricopeptide (TPR) repeat protein